MNKIRKKSDSSLDPKNSAIDNFLQKFAKRVEAAEPPPRPTPRPKATMPKIPFPNPKMNLTPIPQKGPVKPVVEAPVQEVSEQAINKSIPAQAYIPSGDSSWKVLFSDLSKMKDAERDVAINKMNKYLASVGFSGGLEYLDDEYGEAFRDKNGNYVLDGNKNIQKINGLSNFLNLFIIPRYKNEIMKMGEVSGPYKTTKEDIELFRGYDPDEEVLDKSQDIEETDSIVNKINKKTIEAEGVANNIFKDIAAARSELGSTMALENNNLNAIFDKETLNKLKESILVAMKSRSKDIRLKNSLKIIDSLINQPSDIKSNIKIKIKAIRDIEYIIDSIGNSISGLTEEVKKSIDYINNDESYKTLVNLENAINKSKELSWELNKGYQFREQEYSDKIEYIINQISNIEKIFYIIQRERLILLDAIPQADPSEEGLETNEDVQGMGNNYENSRSLQMEGIENKDMRSYYEKYTNPSISQKSNNYETLYNHLGMAKKYIEQTIKSLSNKLIDINENLHLELMEMFEDLYSAIDQAMSDIVSVGKTISVNENDIVLGEGSSLDYAISIKNNITEINKKISEKNNNPDTALNIFNDDILKDVAINKKLPVEKISKIVNDLRSYVERIYKSAIGGRIPSELSNEGKLYNEIIDILDNKVLKNSVDELMLKEEREAMKRIRDRQPGRDGGVYDENFDESGRKQSLNPGSSSLNIEEVENPESQFQTKASFENIKNIFSFTINRNDTKVCKRND